MSYKNDLLNAQVSINRAVFEMNRTGRLIPEPVRPEYIKVCIEDAIKELTNSLKLLKSEIKG